MGNKDSDRANNVGCLYSWFAIVVAFFMCWPIAVLLLIGRAKRDRRTTFGIGKTVGWGGFILGIPLLLLLLFFPAMYAGPKENFWPCMGGMFIAFAIFGLPALIVGGIGTRLVFWSGRIKAYLELIVNQHVFSIPQIAAKMNLPETKVISDLKEMTQRRFLPDAQIDETRKVIIVPAVEAQMRFQEEVAQEQRPAPSMAPAAVPCSTPPPPMAPPRPEVARPQMRACKCCGANNLVWPNREPLCEFCGSIV